MTRSMPHLPAWCSAKRRLASVLPPPVGTVRRYAPLGRPDADRQASDTCLRSSSIGDRGINPLSLPSRKAASAAHSGYCPCCRNEAAAPFEKSAVSVRSASIRQLNRNRTRSEEHTSELQSPC